MNTHSMDHGCPAGLADCPKRVLVRSMVEEFMRHSGSIEACKVRLDVMQRMADEILRIVQPEDDNGSDRVAEARP